LSWQCAGAFVRIPNFPADGRPTSAWIVVK
jgi:hypothetical protein